MPEVHEQPQEVKVIGPRGRTNTVSQYLANSKDGQDALAAQGFRVLSDVIPQVPKVERPPLVDPEKEQLRAELEALKAQVAQGNHAPTEPATAAPVTDHDEKRGPGRPPKAPK